MNTRLTTTFLLCFLLTGSPSSAQSRLELLRREPASTKTHAIVSKREPYPWEGHVLRWAAHFSLEPALVMGIIHAESYYRARAVSSVGARGLMQLKIKTALDYGVRGEQLWVPERNIYAGCAHLRWLLDHYKDDVTRALAAYNFGHRRVRRDRAFVKRESVRRYVRKIMRARHTWRSRVLTPLPQEPAR